MSLLNRHGFKPQFLRAIVVTVLLVAIYRLGLQIQIPFINAAALQQGELMSGIFNSQFSNPVWFSIFSLGIMPYVSAYVLVEIFSLFIPPLKKLRSGDLSGRRKLKRLALLLALPLGALQGYGFVNNLNGLTLSDGIKVLAINTSFEFVLLVTILLSSMCFLIMLTELISKFGIGHGISIIIFSGICANFIHSPSRNLSILIESGALLYLLLIVIFGFMAASAVILMRTKVVIPVTRADSENSRDIFQFNLCPSGNVALPYATSLIMLPTTILFFFDSGHRYVAGFHPNTWLYSVLLVLFIFGFSYLFAWLFLHPKRRIARMKARGWQFADPDKIAEKYLLHRQFVYTLPWTLFLCALAIIPNMLIGFANVPFYVGGATLYIAIAIGLDILDRYRFHRETQSGELIKIAEFHDIYDAAMIKKHIDSEGVRSHLQGYYHRQLYYFFGPYIGMSLMVAKKDVEFCENLILRYHDALGLVRTKHRRSGSCANQT